MGLRKNRREKVNPVRPYSIKSRSSKIADISNKSWYYTYVLWSEKNAQFYTGTTFNLRQRLKEHTQGLAVSTKHKRPLRLIYPVRKYPVACRRVDIPLQRGQGLIFCLSFLTGFILKPV